MGICESENKEMEEFNNEKNIHMEIKLDRIVFFPGEVLSGKIILSPKDTISIKNLVNTTVNFTIMEIHQYKYTKSGGHNSHASSIINNQKFIPFKTSLNFTQYQNADLTQGLTIPFSVQLPINIYPTVGNAGSKSNNFVKHFLAADFPSIEAKKSEAIVIKNIPYYSPENGLFRSPAVATLNTTKHNFLVNKGKLSCVLTLPKNSFSYEEIIPFTVDLDLSLLEMKVTEIIVKIDRVLNKNDESNHEKAITCSNKLIAEKHIPIDQNLKQIKLSDNISFPNYSENFPKTLYELLEKHRTAEVLQNSKGLFPSCYHGLISVQYQVTVQLVMDATFTSSEELSIPIDFYMPYTVPPQINNEPFNNYKYMNYPVE